MRTHDPFEHYGIDIETEAVGLATYLNLAHSLEHLTAVLANELEEIDGAILQHLLHTVQGALAWMDSIGISDRHPDLQAIPGEVSPREFKGGQEGMVRWCMDEMIQMTKLENSKRNSVMN